MISLGIKFANGLIDLPWLSACNRPPPLFPSPGLPSFYAKYNKKKKIYIHIYILKYIQIYTTYSKIYTNICTKYSNIQIYIQKIETNTSRPAGGPGRPGPVRRRLADRTGSGGGAPPDRAGPGRPGRARGLVFVSIFCISFVYLYIIFDICFMYLANL